MALSDLLASLFGFVFDNPQNAGLAAAILVIGHHIRKGAVLGVWLSYAGVGAMLLAIALLFGVIQTDFGLLRGFIELVLSFTEAILG